MMRVKKRIAKIQSSNSQIRKLFLFRYGIIYHITRNKFRKIFTIYSAISAICITKRRMDRKTGNISGNIYLFWNMKDTKNAQKEIPTKLKKILSIKSQRASSQI